MPGSRGVWRCSAGSAGQPGATLPARVPPLLENLLHGAAPLGEGGFCPRCEEK